MVEAPLEFIRPPEPKPAGPKARAPASANDPAPTSGIAEMHAKTVSEDGPFIFAETIRRTRERVPGCRIEVLIPDFQGIERSLQTVLDAKPDVLNHNIETVPRLYRMARSGGKYPRSLELLDRARRYAPA